jgi:hypothetical protein
VGPGSFVVTVHPSAMAAIEERDSVYAAFVADLEVAAAVVA